MCYRMNLRLKIYFKLYNKAKKNKKILDFKIVRTATKKIVKVHEVSVLFFLSICHGQRLVKLNERLNNIV